jgi:hypothetical protein
MENDFSDNISISSDLNAFHMPRISHKRSVTMRIPPITNNRRRFFWQLVPSFESSTNQECWDRLGYWDIGMCRKGFETQSSSSENSLHPQKAVLESMQVIHTIIA